MATYDRDRGEVVLRIVYDGLAFVGKTENLRSLERSFRDRSRAPLESPMLTSSGRTQYFDWLELAVGFVDDTPARCQVLSVPGQFALADRRVFLLRRADAVVFVCESTADGARSAQRAFRSLSRALANVERSIPIVVQANMQDREGAIEPSEVAKLLGAHSDAASHRFVGSSALSDDGVRPTFLVALAAARDNARDVIARDGLDALAHPDASPRALFEAMTHPDPEHDAIVQAVLDAALDD
ncbi:MAG: hypothetical protein JNK05_30310 [Myxococcales bacterium]|nr:hypothetical protein [Myxococcales bacterium]